MAGIRVKAGKKVVPFSKKKLEHSIELCGAKSSIACEVAELVYAKIALSLHDSVISTHEIKKRTWELLQRKDKKAAAAYAEAEQV